ncbi:MAG: phosphoribosylaminoimidazole-succinocarboxamide synthase [Planctomycetes bacterium DG_23]|nr:MAG: phosphoribosylaminoimidazole-succinocarboxamide synthase [Planctomycetes bacterium DG_23]
MIITEGKTKIVRLGLREKTVILETKDVLTSGDAAKREKIEGISVHKTTQAANVFTLLNQRGLPTAFIERVSPTSLLCQQCEMLPLELVVRRYAWGAFLKRNPGFIRGNGTPHCFDDLVCEFFHKWSVVAPPISETPYLIEEDNARRQFLREGIWQEGVYTDPHIQIEDECWRLYPAKEPLSQSAPLMEIEPLCSRDESRKIIQSLMIPSFLVLESAWRRVVTLRGSVTLADMKIEVGRRLLDGELVIADVIDNDSWRIWPGGDARRQLDKQCFRDNDPLSTVAEKYAIVTELTKEFLAQ